MSKKLTGFISDNPYSHSVDDTRPAIADRLLWSAVEFSKATGKPPFQQACRFGDRIAVVSVRNRCYLFMLMIPFQTASSFDDTSFYTCGMAGVVQVLKSPYVCSSGGVIVFRVHLWLYLMHTRSREFSACFAPSLIFLCQ